MKILVTGAYYVGIFTKIIKQTNEQKNHTHEYHFVSSKYYDLRNEIDIHILFRIEVEPDIFI
jgi:hypothetical protein